jgi:hypothetical protein
MSAALQICHTTFDATFLKLPPEIRTRIEAKIDEMGLRLKTFPHHRLKGHNRYRLRWEIIGLSMPTMWNETSSTCWASAIAGKFTVDFEPNNITAGTLLIMVYHPCYGRLPPVAEAVVCPISDLTIHDAVEPTI